MIQPNAPSSVGNEGLRRSAPVDWLIRLRWVAAVGVIVGAFLGRRVLGIAGPELPLYGIALLLLVYNAVMRALLGRAAKSSADPRDRTVTKLINVQILADLVLLAILLHFSGGPENPFIFFFIFHMIIASILLPAWESYLQATAAVLLLGSLLLLEYAGLIRHHCLRGFVAQCRYEEPAYLAGMFAVFALTFYLVVYMTSYIAIRLRRAECAQRQANELLRQKDRIKDEYVAHLTHEIKGHLAAIQFCLGVAVTGPIGEQPADFVNRAYLRTQKLTAFVRMLLKLTRLRLSGTVGRDGFALADVVRDAVNAVRSQAQAKSIDIQCRIEPTVDGVLGHRGSMEEAVTNLLLNAVTYTPVGGRISIDMATQAEEIVLEISDAGIGVPAEQQARIFEEFFRASNAKQVEPNGAGLGLSLARQVIELHGGAIDCSSVEGRGTTFRVVVPRATWAVAREPVEPAWANAVKVP